jgi:predicted nucleic-acid-binding protein
LGEDAVKFTADTNILLRALTGDDDIQSPIAQRVLIEAHSVIVTNPVLCEMVWVLARGYRHGHVEIAEAVRRIAFAQNVIADRPAVEAGLTILDAGGDFADGVIAYAGRWLGAETFLSFDKEAVTLLQRSGEKAQLLG